MRSGAAGRPVMLAAAVLLLAPVGSAANATHEIAAARLPYAATGVLGRLDTSRGAPHTVLFDTSSGLYSVDGTVRNDVRHRRSVAFVNHGELAHPTTQWAFDFASLRLARGTSVVVRGSKPLVLLSRGDAVLAASLSLDGVPGASGGRGAGGGGGGGAGALAVFAGGRLTMTGTISARGGAGGFGDPARAARGRRAYTGGAGGGGAVTLGAANGVTLDGAVLTTSGDRVTSGPLTVVGPARYGTTARLNGAAVRTAGVRELGSLVAGTFRIFGGAGGGGGGGSGLPVAGPAGYVRSSSVGGRPGPGGGAGGASGYAMAGGSGGKGGDAASNANAGGGGGGGGGAYAGAGGGAGASHGSAGGAAAGAPGASGQCSASGSGGNGGSAGTGGGGGGRGGSVQGGTGESGHNASSSGAGGGGGGGGADSCSGVAPGAGGAGGAGGSGGGGGGAGNPGANVGHRGSCGFNTLNDTTPGGQLGGQDVWNGEVYLAVVMFDPNGLSASGTVSCELRVNGVSQGTVLGPDSGTGIVVDANTIQFTASVTDVVSLCLHVNTDYENSVDCNDATTTQVVPQPVIDAIDAVFAAINGVIDLLNQNVFSQLDPTICSVLIGLAPTVNGLGHPELIHIDPATGDLFIGGIIFTPPPGGDLFWDCPPYVTA
jgi:hypothetical protein